MVKTNVMRLLDAANISYESKEYEVDEKDLSGSHAADMMGADHDTIFKTLVLKGEKTGYLVCCIPVDEELDLKKVAKAAHDKKVELIPMKDLLPLTGYIRGGCSPIGMKKKFPLYIEETAILFDKIAVSAAEAFRFFCLPTICAPIQKAVLRLLFSKRVDIRIRQ